MSQPRVIGITGYAQHGKDTLGQMFVEQCGYTKMAFADALRHAVLVLNPWVDVPDWHAPVRYADLLECEGYEEAKKRPEVRRLLQVMGTEVVRNIIGKNAWVSALETSWEYLGYPDIVITDVRFPNEAEWVKARGSLIRVERPEYNNGISTEHPSEASIATLPVDRTVSATDMAGLTQQFQLLRGLMGL